MAVRCLSNIDDLDDVIDVLHQTPCAVPDEPVLVAGDPEALARETRLRDGIPIPPRRDAHIREMCARCGAQYLLQPS